MPIEGKFNDPSCSCCNGSICQNGYQDATLAFITITKLWQISLQTTLGGAAFMAPCSCPVRSMDCASNGTIYIRKSLLKVLHSCIDASKCLDSSRSPTGAISQPRPCSTTLTESAWSVTEYPLNRLSTVQNSCPAAGITVGSYRRGLLTRGLIKKPPWNYVRFFLPSSSRLTPYEWQKTDRFNTTCYRLLID